jgi:hypothetical protein
MARWGETDSTPHDSKIEICMPIFDSFRQNLALIEVRLFRDTERAVLFLQEVLL